MAEKHKEKTKETYLNQIQKLLPILPIVGIFSVLCYVLGRLHIESYYYNLGINPNTLVFKTDDFMFSSYNLVIMCIVISLMLFAYWVGSKRKGKIKGNKWILFITIFVLFLFSGWILFSNNILQFANGSGLIAGIFFGIFLILYALFLQILPGKKIPESAIIIVLVIILLVLLPIITDRLALVQAINDKLSKFPITTIICKSELPIQLQSSSPNSTNIIEGQLIITNNNMTYVLQPDNTVYAIPVESIKDIKFTKK
jgi:hypothetical protein